MHFQLQLSSRQAGNIMSVARFSEWRKLPVSLAELCINTTLRCGQSFRWRKSEDDEWRCVLRGRIVCLKQDSTHLHYKTYFPPSAALPTPPSESPLTGQGTPGEDDTEALLVHYFNLGQNLTELYEWWSSADPNFKKKAPKFTGVRILRQDAWEALVSFICSSNNNIARISQMVEKLCLNYGPFIGYVDKRPYHDFPSPAVLASNGVEAHLRELGFGYRAKYIYKTALMMVNDHGDGWLDSLRNPECPAFGTEAKPAAEMDGHGRPGYREAHEKLLGLQGVGPKVADCVCLMGLGWGESVPVDTHVWQIAQRDYKFGKGKHKSLTKATYDAVGDHFRELWGKEAGWAHSVLFTADLRAFSERLAVKTEVQETILKKDEAEVPVKEELDAGKLTQIQTTNRVSVKREASDELERTVRKTEDVETKVVKRRRSARGV